MSTEGTHVLLKIFAGLPKTVRGRPISLNADPKGEKILYCNGNCVFIRNIEQPDDCDMYSQHSKDTSCAAYAPSGFYIASGDITGKLRIWDTINKEHILKYEYQVLGGTIKDIAWTEDSKRIAVCGDGREKYANAIMWDTGTSVGNLNSPTKSCNNISIKQTRPYRLAVASEDYYSFFFEGPPFKYSTQYDGHTNFANCVRFSPDGTKYVTGGADGKCFVFDGKTGDMLHEMCEPAGRIHKAGIYGLSWSPDSKYLMSCSADKTVKLWNFSDDNYKSNKEEVVFTMGSDLEDMQVACAWAGSNLISVSLSGHINYLDKDNPSKPKKVIKGHNKAIVASCLTQDSTLFTTSFDGKICYWDIATGVAEVVGGKGHTTQVTKMHCLGDELVTCSMDDTIRYISVKDKVYTETSIKLDSQPQAVCQGGLGLVVVACADSLVVVQDKKITHKYKLNFPPTAVNISTDLNKVAVGTADEDHRVVIYDIEGDQLKESCSFQTNGAVTDVRFSPDSKYLACCTGKKQVKIVLTSDFKTERANWASHSGKVNTISWTPNSKYLASCGIDGCVITWDVENAERAAVLRGAHALSVDVTSVQWSDDTTLLTTGRQDCSVRMWQITH